MLTPILNANSQWFWNDATVALIGLVGVLILSNGCTGGLGFRSTPAGGWLRWCRMACWLGAAVGLFLVICATVALAAGWQVPVHRTDPALFVPRLLLMCVYAPVVEELVYRSLVVAAVQPALGDRGAIAASGLLFAAVHWIYGNPSPENQIGGFLLAWVFVRSETILVPLALHGGGNLIVLSGQVAAWYWLPGDAP
jgi:membrane protease YdiL (CAAX protease family)